MRSPAPTFVRDHRYGLPIHTIKFHHGSTRRSRLNTVLSGLAQTNVAGTVLEGRRGAAPHIERGGRQTESTVFGGVGPDNGAFDESASAAAAALDDGEATTSSATTRIMSADAKSIKVWDRVSGKPYTAIEPSADLSHFTVVGESGLVLATGEQRQVQVFFVPQLGPAPRWAAFLENLTEEMEESRQTTVYDDYQFVTREQLEEWGLGHLIGTNLLRAYMHGFFMDSRLFRRVRDVADPDAYERYMAERVRQEIEKKREGRINVVDRLPKVNREYAQLLLRKQQAGVGAGAGAGAGAPEEDEKAEAVYKDKAGKVKVNPLGDTRFTGMFSDADFSIDECAWSLV